MNAPEPSSGTAETNMIVRASGDADLEAIAAIYGHHVLHGTASFETEPPSVQEMRRRRSDLLLHRFPHFVAEESGIILGYGYAGPYRARAAYRDTVEDSVYLRPDAIGRGIDKLLLMALVAACEAHGLRQMVAVVGDSSNTASIRLHERCGFRLAGVLEAVGYKHGQWLDTVLLQRTLGPGSTVSPQRRA